MRKNIVAGNWKMNTTVEEGVALATEINKQVAERKNDGVGAIIAPPFTHLSEIKKVIDTNKVGLASQNCASELKGAYTGEISIDMLKAVGCTSVILGHSERRAYYKEDSEVLSKKVKIVLEGGLTPIFCCGEVLEERKAKKHFDVVKSQIEEAIFDLSAEDFGKIVIAYEPVWAIGTGEVASPEQAQEIHKFIRETIAAKYNQQVADDTTILYGGSCKPSNAQELFSNPDVDGGLIGGAALEANSFLGIINAF